jgi:thiol-disulfide isomerase/thioredoxin
MSARFSPITSAAIFTVLIASVIGLAGCATVEPAAVSRGLPAPRDPDERAYLGLADGGTNFVLEDIQCEVLIVDLFDMYCHVCQTVAPHVNALYREAQDRGLGRRVKFIGLGVGDTQLEVTTFKQKLKVPFPVFPDRKTAAARQFGDFKLPNTLVLKHRNGQLQVVQRMSAVPRDAAEFFSHILSNSAALSPRQGIPGEAIGHCPVGANGVECRGEVVPR